MPYVSFWNGRIYALLSFHNIDFYPVSNKLCNPSNSHHASFGICKLLVIPHQMVFVPWILLHSFVVIHAVKYNLAETVKVCQVHHLVVEEPGHEASGLNRVVDLGGVSSRSMINHSDTMSEIERVCSA